MKPTKDSNSKINSNPLFFWGWLLYKGKNLIAIRFTPKEEICATVLIIESTNLVKPNSSCVKKRGNNMITLKKPIRTPA